MWPGQYLLQCNSVKAQFVHNELKVKKLLKSIYYSSLFGKILISPVKGIYDLYRFYLLPERIFIKRTFKEILGYKLNLATPKTFNEKIQWSSMFDRTPLHIVCTDKYSVRDHIRKKIGKSYLIPLVFYTTNQKEMIPENLPQFPFIIKTNHACGNHIMVKNKLEIDWIKVQNEMKKLLKSNFYYNFREWQYKEIKPKIIVEKLLLDKKNKIPYEYKFFCANGQIGFIIVIIDKYSKPKTNFYNSKWNLIEYGSQISYKANIGNKEILKKMSSLAMILASDFKFVRVDFYLCDNKIYFGELTFSPSGGFELFNNYEWDRYFGDKLNL